MTCISVMQLECGNCDYILRVMPHYALRFGSVVLHIKQNNMPRGTFKRRATNGTRALRTEGLETKRGGVLQNFATSD